VLAQYAGRAFSGDMGADLNQLAEQRLSGLAEGGLRASSAPAPGQNRPP
jgi:hypothetical protein